MSKTSDYFVGEMIGEGSYGCVVHAKHKQTKHDVAIKVVDKLSLNKHPQVLQSILTEQKILSSWNTPKDDSSVKCVVKLLASFHDEECIYLVMECCHGGNLMQLIQKGRAISSVSCSNEKNANLYYASIPHYGLQLVHALEYIHSHGVCHADFKPDNILVTQQGQLQLADFGSAMYLQSLTTDAVTTTTNGEQPTSQSKQSNRDTNEIQDPNQSPSCTNTAANTVLMGTVDYASPELLKGNNLVHHHLSVSIDLWSFGCVLYAMWRGVSPFHAESDALAIQSIFEYCKSMTSFNSNKDTNEEPPISGDEYNQLPEFLQGIKDPDWKVLIGDLLKVDPMDRRGMSDVTTTNIDKKNDRTHMVSYTSIRSSKVWEEVALSQIPQFLPSLPPWSEKQAGIATAKESRPNDSDSSTSKYYGMKDGAQGWSAFLLS